MRARKPAATSDFVILATCAVMTLALCAYTLIALWPAIHLRADLLMWSETDMVGNMIKLETRQPIYGPPEDGNSEVYTPGSSLLTYATLKASGQPLSVPAMRRIQLILVTLAALLATYNTHLLARLAGVRFLPRPAWLWQLTVFALLWLAATSPYVNRFVLCLHTDAAVLLTSTIGFWAALRYLETPRTSRFATLAVIPGAGFFVKQLLAAWAPAMALMLAARAPRNWRRWSGYTMASIVGIVAVIGFCVVLWGNNYLFWTFEILGGERRRIALVSASGISLLRSVDHLLRAWSELGLGVLGGLLLLRGSTLRTLGPLWLAWLALVASQALVSGSSWGALYYFGPSTVFGLSWLLVALSSHWRGGVGLVPASDTRDQAILWRRLHLPVAVVGIALALHSVPSRDPSAARFFPPNWNADEVERYVGAIEEEARNVAPSRLLIESGNWIYLPARHLAKYRAVSLADQPVIGLYRNFAGLLEEIRSQRYEKILVQNLHDPQFSYDWFSWEQSTGVREALLQHYREVRTIPPPSIQGSSLAGIWRAAPVSVLVPVTAD